MSCNFIFSAEVRQHAQAFRLLPRLIGAGGSRMKTIARSCSGKLRIRGKGSGFLEAHNKEADLPLHIALSCRTAWGFEMGKDLLRQLLRVTEREFAEYCSEGGHRPPRTFVRCSSCRQTGAFRPMARLPEPPVRLSL